MYNTSKILNIENKLISVIVLFFIASGIYFRFVDIGKWCFAVDEFFIATSVSKILDYGIPKFEYGGYYTRGLLFQYFEAFISLIWGFNEGTLRYGSLFFNLLSFPALYLLGRRIGGKTLGLAAICIFSISLWEIELSRFVRMYTAFQCAFLWFLLILLNVIVDKDQNKIKWLYAIAICSIFVHEATIFILLLLFLPLLFGSVGEIRKHILASSVILLCGYFYLKFDFRHLGTSSHLPIEYQKFIGSKNSIFPDLYFLNTIIQLREWFFAYVLVFSINIYAVYRLWKDIYLTNDKKTIMSILVFLSLAQMFGLLLLVMLAMIVINKVDIKDSKNKAIQKTIACVVITFNFWLLYGIFTNKWIGEFENLSSISIKKILVVLFKYPNIFDALIFPWGNAIPIISICFLIAALYITFLLFVNRENNKTCQLRVLIFVMISCTSLLGILPTNYRTTRYGFFLYPVAILVLLYFIKYLAERFGSIKCQSLIFFFFAIFIFVNTDDFEINHLWNISSPQINFRMHHDLQKAIHFYPRCDFKSPANFIDKNAGENDIIIIKELPCCHYLKRISYVFKSDKNIEFSAISILNGTKEFWTGAYLMYKYDDLVNLLNNIKETVWIIDYTEKYPGSVNPQLRFENLSKYAVYTSIDGAFNVLKIPPGNNHY
ncbi:MAG: glycosyltransferase family 39 protein [Candidatus Scalindua sp.]|nr:glycosyltransferase family 39 protein [Candidatus Scalindua sp.]